MQYSTKAILAVASISMLFGEGVLAAEVWHTSTIKTVYPLASGGFVLIFNADSPACPHPNAVGKYHYVVPSQNDMTVEGAKKLYAAALLALAMDRAVTIAFEGSSAECYVNRLSV